MGRGVLALLWQLSSVQCRHLYSSAPTATIDANFYENYAPFRPKTSYEPDHSVPTYLCHTETAHRAIDQRLREKNFNFVLDIPNFPKNNPCGLSLLLDILIPLDILTITSKLGEGGL